MVLLMLVIAGASLTYVVFAQISLYTSNSRWAHAAAWLFVLLFLRLTEGRWFMFTCDRFARIANNELVLFGAFGRKRLHRPLDESLFYYTKDQEGNYRNLLVEDADARMRSFSLRLCEDPDALTDALSAVDRFKHERELAEEEIAKLTEEQRAWRKTYMQVFLTPISLLGCLQMVFHVFWSIQLLSAAWHAGIALGALATFPLCVWSRRTLRHFRWFNLPAHHYWRSKPLGHAVAEAFYYLKFSALMLAAACLYSYFFAYNVGMISLLKQPRHATTADVSASKARCNQGKHHTIGYWKLHVQFPGPYKHFNGDWCSYVSVKSAPPEAGRYTVYLRESEFAHELTFEP